DDLLPLVLAAVDEQPARALRNVAPDQRDADGEHRAEAERQAPAEGRTHDRRVEQRDGQEGPGRGTDPEGAVDGDVDPPAVPRRDELVDRRVDGGVLTTDARAG